MNTAPIKSEKQGNGEEDVILALNYLTNTQLEERFRALTDTSPPRPMTRSLLITAVAYETLRNPHRERVRHVAR